MKKLFLTALFSLLVFVAAAPAQKSSPYKEGEVLVKFRASTRKSDERHFIARHASDMRKIRAIDAAGLTHYRLTAGQNVDEAIAELSQDPEVEFVQPNFIYHIAAVPNDANYGNLWGLKNTGQLVAPSSYGTNNPGTSGKDIGAESAWNLITDCSAVTVAVVDTGVNYNHQELATNMWNGGVTYPNHGYDFVSNDNDPMDLHGHGTHVAGVIGGSGNDATGTLGVCWKASIMAVRVLGSTGTGTTANIVSGVNFAVNHGAKVINMSLGGAGYDAAFDAALTNAANQGVAIIVAAGNSGLNVNTSGNAIYPCNYNTPTLICVAALDQSYALATFSNYGSASVDVGAPGTNIISSYHGTVTPITDTFAAGWTKNDGIWTYNSVVISGTAYDMLTNPANWSTFTTGYANNLDSRAYKSFNLAGYNDAVLNFSAFINTESTKDFFNVAFDATGADPFAAGTSLDSLSGNLGNAAISYSYDLANCLSATCSLGFQLTSDAAVNADGVGLQSFQIDALMLNNTTYKTLNGTSMATPFVSGIAAMLFAYNPYFTATDVALAIKGGGTTTNSLNGKTTTGKAANAYGSLIYIAPPTGITANLR